MGSDIYSDDANESLYSSTSTHEHAVHFENLRGLKKIRFLQNIIMYTHDYKHINGRHASAQQSCVYCACIRLYPITTRGLSA